VSAAKSFHTQIFVNLPVANLNRSVEFFTKLGYKFNPQFTDENATSMIIADDIFAMLVVDSYFKTFTPKNIADAKTTTEVLTALSLESRDAVNKMVESAIAAGARRYKEPTDYGFMYQWGYEDLDGHLWELFWMDPSHVQ
jgi:predicted lactoylglutathione lyase